MFHLVRSYVALVYLATSTGYARAPPEEDELENDFLHTAILSCVTKFSLIHGKLPDLPGLEAAYEIAAPVECLLDPVEVRIRVAGTET